MEIKLVKTDKERYDTYIVVAENGGYTVAEFYVHSWTEDYNTVGKTKTYEEALEMVKEHAKGEILEIEEANGITW